MSGPITRLEEIVRALETREHTARSAAEEADGEELDKQLHALADDLAQDRQTLAAVAKKLRQRRDDFGADEELTGHGDRNDPDSDMGL